VKKLRQSYSDFSISSKMSHPQKTLLKNLGRSSSKSTFSFNYSDENVNFNGERGFRIFDKEETTSKEEPKNSTFHKRKTMLELFRRNNEDDAVNDVMF